MFELLRERRPSEALEILCAHPELAWHRDLHSGGYPLHLAAWHGYTSLATFLASLDGTCTQRDGRRDMPLALATRRGNAEVEAALLAAGAAPAEASYLPEPRPRPRQQQAGAAAAEDEEYSSWGNKARADYRRGGHGRGGRDRGGVWPDPSREPSGW